MGFVDFFIDHPRYSRFWPGIPRQRFSGSSYAAGHLKIGAAPGPGDGKRSYDSRRMTRPPRTRNRTPVPSAPSHLYTNEAYTASFLAKPPSWLRGRFRPPFWLGDRVVPFWGTRPVKEHYPADSGRCPGRLTEEKGPKQWVSRPWNPSPRHNPTVDPRRTKRKRVMNFFGFYGAPGFSP